MNEDLHSAPRPTATPRGDKRGGVRRTAANRRRLQRAQVSCRTFQLFFIHKKVRRRGRGGKKSHSQKTCPGLFFFSLFTASHFSENWKSGAGCDVNRLKAAHSCGLTVHKTHGDDTDVSLFAQLQWKNPTALNVLEKNFSTLHTEHRD